MIYRVHLGRGPAEKRVKGFTETGCTGPLEAAHQRLGGPVALLWAGLQHARRRPPATAARHSIRARRLPSYAPEFNPAEGVWSHLKRSVSNLAKHDIDQLTTMVRTRLKRMQYRPGPIDGFVAKPDSIFKSA